MNVPGAINLHELGDARLAVETILHPVNGVRNGARSKSNGFPPR